MDCNSAKFKDMNWRIAHSRANPLEKLPSKAMKSGTLQLRQQYDVCCAESEELVIHEFLCGDISEPG